MILTSKNNPLVKETAALKDKKARKTLGMFLVEGEKMVAECKKSGLRIDRVFVSQSYKGETEDGFVCLSDDVFKYLSDEKTPQGILCRVEIPVCPLNKPENVAIVLDGVSDPANVGAIIRTANAAGYKDVYLIGCADPYSPKSVRASMSGVFFVRIYQGTREEILKTLQGIPLICADMDGENVFRFHAPERFALVIGNEGNGISDEVFSAATHKIRIPMEETQESLNAAVSAGIAMYLLKKDSF